LGYTVASVKEFIGDATTIRDALSDAIDAAEEYIGAVEDDEADDDDVGLALQNFESALDEAQVNGLQLTHSLKEGE
jgi:hypothetical protein